MKLKYSIIEEPREWNILSGERKTNRVQQDEASMGRSRRGFCCDHYIVLKWSKTVYAHHEGKDTISQQRNGNDKKKIFKKNQMEILELWNYSTWNKISTGRTSQLNGNDRERESKDGAAKNVRINNGLNFSKCYEKWKFIDIRWSRGVEKRKYKEAHADSFK